MKNQVTMIDKLHNLSSFVNKGLKEKSTWLGLIIIIFGWSFYKEIHQLISNILLSPEFANKILDGICTLAGFMFILYKEKK